MKKLLDELLKARKRVYKESQKIVLLANDAVRHFWKNCKTYQSKDRPVPFDPRSLFPGKEDSKIAELVADHFNAISGEFRPLEPSQIPSTFSSPVPLLLPHEVFQKA